MPSQKGIQLPPEYNTLQVGIALYDPNSGTILTANDRLESIFGYTTEELRGISIDNYTANTYSFSETGFKKRLTASARGNPQQFTWRIKRADGELVWAEIHLSDWTISDHSWVLAQIRDITEQYETRHREELFWRVLRHNLRNDASVLLGYADIIRNETQTETVQEASDIIHSRAENLGNMAESLKEIGQAITQTEDSQVRKHAPTAVKEVVKTVSSRYPPAEITINERADMWIAIDDTFTYALTEALENAVRHSEEPAPVVEVDLGPSPNTGRVEIRVSDTNSPIAEEEIKALRDPANTRNVFHGSGVGLFVMKWCIESLGGEVKFERSESKGNTVYFYLPPKTPPTG